MTPEQQAAVSAAQSRLNARSPEQQAALQAAQSRLSQAPPDAPAALDNIGRSVVKGATQALGFPGEIALMIPKLGAFAAGDLEAQDALSGVSPTDAFQDIFGFLGMRSDPDLEGRPFRERLIANTAESVTGGALGIGLGGQARGVIKKGAQKLGEGRLGRFAVEDAIAGTAGASAKTLAEELGLSDQAAGVSEFATSFLTGGLIAKAQLAREGIGAVRDARSNFSAREWQRASEFVQAPLILAGEDPKAAAAAIRSRPRMPGDDGRDLLTSGARSESPALIALQNTLIKSNPELQAQFVASKKDLKQFIHDEMKTALGGDGVPDDFVDHYLKSADVATHFTEKAHQAAIEAAAKEIADLPPIGIDYSTPIKEKLDAMKRIDRDIEKDLWRGIGGDALTSSADPKRPFLKESFDDLQAEVARAGRASETLTLPDRTIMGAVESMVEDGTATADELIALRSSILDASAKAASENDHNLARRLNGLAEGALNSLDSLPQSEAVAQARQFSRDLNDRYSRDTIARLLGSTAARGEKVAGNQTLEELFKPGERGRTNMRALNLAFGGTPPEAKSYVLQRFYRQAIEDNGINVGDAERFIDQHRPLLEETGLMDVVSSYVATGRAVNQSALDVAQLTSAQASDVAAKYMRRYGETGDDLVNFLGGALKSDSRAAQQTLAEMYQNALTDVSGAAVKGLQSATVEAAMKAMYTTTDDAVQALPEVSARIVNALTATGQFTPEQVSRVKQMGEILHQQASAERLRAFRGQSNTPQDLAAANFVGVLARFVGLTKIAPLVKGSGPGSLAAASLIGRKAQDLVQGMTKDDAMSLIKQSIFDPDLAAALLDSPQTMSGKSVGVIRKSLEMTRKALLSGGLRPSQVTIPELSEDEDGR